MKALVVQARDKSEMKLVADVLKKMGIKSSEMDAEDLEDFLLGEAMKKADRTKKVSRDTIMKNLTSR